MECSRLLENVVVSHNEVKIYYILLHYFARWCSIWVFTSLTQLPLVSEANPQVFVSLQTLWNWVCVKKILQGIFQKYKKGLLWDEKIPISKMWIQVWTKISLITRSWEKRCPKHREESVFKPSFNLKAFGASSSHGRKDCRFAALFLIK